MDPLLDYLTQCRDDFAAVGADMRHVLQTVDAELWEVPNLWGKPDPRCGFATWGMPPETLWRHTADDFRPRPVVNQSHDRGWPYWWLHTFHGESAIEPLRLLSYRVVRRFVDLPDATLAVLPRPVPLSNDHPRQALQTPHLWWLRVVHGLAQSHPPGSDLTANQYASPDGADMRERPGGRAIAERERRPCGRVLYSVLQGTVFEASAWALDLLIRAVESTQQVDQAVEQAREQPALPSPGHESADPNLNAPLALIRFMEGRESATHEEIARLVHGAKVSPGAIRGNVKRANSVLEGWEWNRRLSSRSRVIRWVPF